MEQSHRISVFVPLGLSVVALVCTIIIYLVPLRATVNLVRRERRRGHVDTPWTALGIFARVVFYASLTHFLETVGSAGDREWNAFVWSFDRDDLCGHAVAHSSEVHGSEGLK